MTAVMISLLVRYRSCQVDRLLLVLLWLHPISYYALSIGAILVLVDEEKNKDAVEVV